MPFRFVDATGETVDDETHATLRRHQVPRDEPFVVYRYERPGTKPIDFRVTSRDVFDAKVGGMISHAAVVDETDVKAAFVDAHAHLSATERSVQYPAFRAHLAQGLFEVTSQGGYALRFWPEYRVEFIPSLASSHNEN